MSEVWCVASGKGGVGKTFVSSGLGISLAKLRKKVLLIDFDISGANLHTILGLKEFKHSMTEALDHSENLQNLIHKSSFTNLDFIPGFSMPALGHQMCQLKIEKFFKDVRQLNYDIIIFDLGPGVQNVNLSVMNWADRHFLVTNCEPTGIEKTYALIDYLIQEKVSVRNIHLLTNFCRSLQHQNLGRSMESVLFKKHGMHVRYSAGIKFDNAVWQSTFMTNSNLQNVFALMPYAEVCHDFYKICKHLIDPSELRAVS